VPFVAAFAFLADLASSAQASSFASSILLAVVFQMAFAALQLSCASLSLFWASGSLRLIFAAFPARLLVDSTADGLP
jgi:hypothetical protein